MLQFKFDKSGDIDSKRLEEIQRELFKLSKKLNKHKSNIDPYYENDEKTYSFVTSCLDPFKTFRYYISKSRGVMNPSNAWLKCYEIFSHFKLVENVLKSNEKIVLFDNAAFPGSFTLAIHHYVNTIINHKRSKPVNFEWYASSLLEDFNERNILEDEYGLYKNYPERWLMTEENDGNVLNPSNLLDFQKRIGGKVDIYTSDLGFDTSNNFNEQEKLHAPANFGQILAGLMTLKKGGTLLTKQYTFFLPFTMTFMIYISQFFEEFQVIKPETSRRGNSETYLLGTKFKGISSKVQNFLLKKLDGVDKYGKGFDFSPIYTHKNPDKDKEWCERFSNMEVILLASNEIYTRQIKKIERNILTYHQYATKHDTDDEKDKTYIGDVKKAFISENREITDIWLRKYPIYKNKSPLNIKDKFKR